MESELNNKFNDDENIKILEDFFTKEISSTFTPQELLMMSLSFNHIANVLLLYRKYSNVAIFEPKIFKEKHPEFSEIDFDNLNDLDHETLEKLKNIMNTESSEEFGTGSILFDNVTKVIINISSKIYNSYMESYTHQAPEDSEQFFTIFHSCLESSLTFLKTLLSSQS